LLDVTHVSHGLQLWAALPKAFEETDPGFCHTPADVLPEWRAPGLVGRVLIGEAFGVRSPVQTYSPTLYLDVLAEPGALLSLGDEAQSQPFERAVYSIDQPLGIDGDEVPPFHIAVLSSGPSRIAAPQGARYVVIGGEPLDGPRIVWWNFVTSSAERLEQAKADWAQQRMSPIPGDSAEWIPLP
jgi:redox-sensitive bicupin YhaK (pirin superfamily)